MGKAKKDLVIYCARYDHAKAITRFSLYYHKLKGKIEEHERKKILDI